nr:MAG TPA: hypothetical protein [Caudoviricetes sp.]
MQFKNSILVQNYEKPISALTLSLFARFLFRTSNYLQKISLLMKIL